MNDLPDLLRAISTLAWPLLVLALLMMLKPKKK